MYKRLFDLLFCAVILLTASFPVSDHAGARTALASRPQTLPVIELQPVVTTGLSSPLYLTSARDGSNRLFIVERGGIIKVLQPGATSPTTFLDITSKVKSDGGGQGLLGLVFHPKFSINRRFFVYYTRKPDVAIVVAEYLASAADPNTADVAEKGLLLLPRPHVALTDHNGGTMHFGNDGFIYISIGDGGYANDPFNLAQNKDVYWGKMLRLDVDHPNGSVPYSSPSTNPFFGATTGLDEIYAYGLRNPWQFAIDRATDQIYVGDVGQTAREEIDIVTSGGNYGWKVMEGSICNPNVNGGVCTPPDGSILPVAEYDHTVGCSVTGGYVYRGARSTLPLGTYIFGDYCAGDIYMLDSNHQMQHLLDTTQDIVSFGEDEAGELYVLSIHDGTVSRITSSPPPADCSFSLLPTSQSIPDDGGAGSIAVTSAAADCHWIAATNASWITITSNTSGTGNGSVDFSVADNPLVTPRSGKINIGGQQFVINQAASDERAVASLKLSTTLLPGCQSLTGTVKLNAPAPAGGIVVSLSDNLAATTLPATIMFGEGVITKTFNITTAPVNALQSGSVQAWIGATSKYATLRVRPMTVLSLDLSPNPVVGPKSSIGTIILECRAPASGVVVSLSSSRPTVAAPTVSSITFPSGTSSKRFTIRTVDVPASRTATIKATANGMAKSKVLTVN